LKIRPAFIVIPLIILAAAMMGGFVLLWRLFFLSIAVIAMSYVWTRISSRGITGKVRISTERSQVGESFDEEVSISNNSRLPKLLVKVQEESNIPGHTNTAAFNLSPRGTFKWNNTVNCLNRGKYRMGSLTVTTSDPLGFFSKQQNIVSPQEVLVHPRIIDLPLFQPFTRSELVFGPSRWIVNETGPNAAKVREYINGDTLNRIDWHKTAHTGKLMIKEFDPEQSRYASKNIWIVLDLERSARHGVGAENTEEYGITIAASLVKKYIDSGKQVGLIASGERPYLFQPKSDHSNLDEIMEALAIMQATGKVPIDQLLSSEIERLGSGSIIIITSSGNSKMSTALPYLKRNGATAIVILLDASSFGTATGNIATAGNIMSSGFQVYVVRRGDELPTALDSHALMPYMRYVSPAV
jgi:uncharacterized protein (DUF58 family)